MRTHEEQMQITARLLLIDEKEIKKYLHTQAIKAATNQKCNLYWNALANSGQLHGNVPFSSMVAICYNYLIAD